MEQHEFQTDRQYLRAQRGVTLQKIKKPFNKVFTSKKTVAEIYHHNCDKSEFSVDKGLCHGVRNGGELDLFEGEFGVDWIGTEIVKELCDGRRIIQADFSKYREEWLGAFGLIYSNSFDHARCPEETLEVWLKQLKTEGWLYIEWTRWHAKLGTGRNKADCFAAERKEYRKMFEAVCGHVDEIEVQEKKFVRVIFAMQ